MTPKTLAARRRDRMQRAYLRSWLRVDNAFTARYGWVRIKPLFEELAEGFTEAMFDEDRLANERGRQERRRIEEVLARQEAVEKDGWHFPWTQSDGSGQVGP